jgi:TatD DNase family protein
MLTHYPNIQGLKKVIHCYEGDPKYVAQFVDLGCMISFTGNITYDQRRDKSISAVPDDRLMIETDSPYLAPAPHRGQKNEPAYIVEVAQYVARLKNLRLEDLGRILQENSEKFFEI